jgi:N-methylhydantoinase B
MKKFDPVTLEILWRRLLSIVDEADAAVARTAFSSVLRDAHDYTCMFTDRQGRELAQGTFATPGQSGAMALGIKKLVQHIPAEAFRPGDVYITNDPWALAGHLNDVCVLSPIFYQDRLTAFTACVLHHSDIGGRVASDNHDVFEEGLFIPLVKLYDAGKLNEAVLDLIRWNVRTPDQVIGDVRSQIAANHVCAEQVCRTLAEYDLTGLDALADEIIARSEQSIRASIAKVPSGLYRAEGTIEQMAGRADLVVKCALEVAGSDIYVDLTGSSPQVDWGGNVVYNFTYAYVHMAIKSIFDPDIPNNDGSAAPIHLTRPKPVVNCRFRRSGAHADRPLHDRDHLSGTGAGSAHARDRRQRRHARNADDLLRSAQRGSAVPHRDDSRRGSGRQWRTRRRGQLHFPGQRSQHAGRDF